MAGDWIKMRCELQTHPKIVRILSATKSDKFRVIGGLHAVWSVFDAHSKDGSLFGYTPETLDHVIGWDGLSQALLLVNWLVYDGEETLMLPEFDEHNSKSAKRRAEDQKRKRDGRKSPQSVADENGQNADKMRTREEKRREENKAGATKATRLPADWVLPKDWGNWALDEKQDWTREDVVKVAADFYDYWIAKAGRDACKLDWLATWRKWVRNARKPA